jgi:hypothetical protein
LEWYVEMATATEGNNPIDGIKGQMARDGRMSKTERQETRKTRHVTSTVRGQEGEPGFKRHGRPKFPGSTSRARDRSKRQMQGASDREKNSGDSSN